MDAQSSTSLLVSYLQTPSQVDDKTRERLIASCQDLIVSLETPMEAVWKVNHLDVDIAIVRAVLRLGVLSRLAASVEPVPTQDLAAKTTPPCDPDMLARFLRLLRGPLRLVTEEGPDLWMITRRGKALADPGVRSYLELSDSTEPIVLALKEWSTSDPSSRPETAFAIAMPGEKDYFSWLQKDPKRLQDFYNVLATFAKDHPPNRRFLDIASSIPKSDSANAVAFVDIGGGTGSQSLEFKDQFPGLGQVIIQDVEEVLSTTRNDLETKGVKVMVHDFFTPQPVQGALVYYLRQILHDWTEDDCVRILEHIRKAMTKDSILLIDENVVPKQNSHWKTSQRDLMMMAFFNATERTDAQWRSLLTRAGFYVKRIHLYDESTSASLIIAAAEKPNDK